ncbi:MULTISPECIES: DUF6286 domain-containing protein [unclassified Streptomyces]|uniref:DUF6286 domain-containing protein n=1 Tax=unclassified Streptomyces TaxID=2593676 RepID=UPI002E332E76|nr:MULTISPECIES: DUF6286 domain-containing protein [unclassified Streptomyces]WUC68337.1 alkaline shock response membrane anchor protein AmaP [Streptomyces sp. NBC_00539]
MKGHLDPPVRTEQPGTDDAAAGATGQPARHPPGTEQPGGGVVRGRRPWSARRIPAALVALVVAGAAVLVLVDVIRVRVGRSAAAWRTSLARELATRPLDDVWIRIGAVVVALLGLWLIVLALTPGLRRRLPLNSSDADVRAVLDRGAATVFLRDAALRVPGVSRATIHLGRRRLAARAEVRFRDPSEVRADVSTALREQLDRLGLANPPTRISVRARHFRK